jgi:hypothetical protein
LSTLSRPDRVNIEAARRGGIRVEHVGLVEFELCSATAVLDGVLAATPSPAATVPAPAEPDLRATRTISASRPRVAPVDPETDPHGPGAGNPFQPIVLAGRRGGSPRRWRR